MTNISMTPKQRRFVEEYLIDLNATQAAIRAGYAKSGASVEGTRLLANAKIATAVAAAQAKRSERTEITQDYVLATIRGTVERCESSDNYNPQAVLRGLELLGRHLAMFTDKTVNRNTLATLSDEELAARIAEFEREDRLSRRGH